MPKSLFDILQRDPYESELEYFKQNPHVGGMATEDHAVILNPFSELSEAEKRAVLLNEKARAFMRYGGPRPKFKITPKQMNIFKQYGSDQDIRETIAARILSGDPSVGEITPEQLQWVQKDLMMEEPSFDPESDGYDYKTANKYGIKPDKTGHWPSREPKTGLILKGRKHKTWNLTRKREEAAGYKIIKKDNRYYSFPKVVY